MTKGGEAVRYGIAFTCTRRQRILARMRMGGCRLFFGHAAHRSVAETVACRETKQNISRAVASCVRAR